MKALVTGGSGYFGSLLLRMLRERELQTAVLDISDAEDRPADVVFHQADIRDRQAVRQSVQGYDVVFHNVAQVPLAKDRRLFWSVNVEGTRNLCDAALSEGCSKLVYTSSSAVFGIPRTNPVSEQTPPEPREAYGRAKLEGERICREYAEKGLDVTIIRPRTILGHGRLGIFQILFEWVRTGVKIPVLSGGHNTYQFVHAYDLAEACILAAENPGSNLYNIGATRFGTMREGLQTLCEHAKTGARVFSLPMRPVEWAMQVSSLLGLSPLGPYHALMYGRSLYFDISKAQRELGYAPRYSNAEMLIESYEWYQKNHERMNSARETASHHRSAVKEGLLGVMRWF